MFIESLFVPETGCQGLHISQHFSKWGPMKPVSLSFSFFYFDLFIYFYFWLRLHAGFLELQRAGATPCCLTRASHCSGFSCCGAQALGTWASEVERWALNVWLRALEDGLDSCAWA